MAAQAGVFGARVTAHQIEVDTGADLEFCVDSGNGDLVSMRFRGVELQSTESKHSQLASGLGAAQVSVATVGATIVVAARAGDLTQYYMARRGRAAIYMATYAPTLPPIGELRFVARLNVARLPEASQEPDSNVGTAIEGRDVFLLPDGRTSSKFYSARRAAEDTLHGVRGPGVAVYMLMGNREHSAGGPFFKDIATQKTAVTHELYNYMFSNHTQTEAYRAGLHGVYGLLFTDGAAPSAAQADVGFVTGALGLAGFLRDAGRGAVAGRVVGVDGPLPALLTLSNGEAQYWTSASAQGAFRLDGVRPGRYALSLYRGELALASRPVRVQAGATAEVTLAAPPLATGVVWQIGVADGTPAGFRNAGLLAHAHPSDTRMAPWSAGVYLVGSSVAADFPAAQWRDVNTPTSIDFVLAHAAVRAYRLRIMLSLAQGNARPTLRVNQAWSAAVPAASVQPDSRGVTRGTYRGNNVVFDVDIPAAALHAGVNRLDIGIASGKAGAGFLSPGWVFDSVQLIAP